MTCFKGVLNKKRFAYTVYLIRPVLANTNQSMMFIFVLVIPMFVIQQMLRINIQGKQKILTSPQLNIVARKPEKEVKLTDTVS